MVEDVEDTVLKTQLSSNSGNLYKPQGLAATFAEGTDDTGGYSLKNNEEEATYADILELYGILNNTPLYSDQRPAWKADLENIFDVETFLKWLSVNTVIQNFDAYGQMPHNYYLYNNPSTGKLQWIPWDHNLAIKNDRRCPPLNHSNSSMEYPLIHLLLGDPDYYRSYAQHVRDFAQNFFEINELGPLLEEYRALLAPSVAAERPGYTHTSPTQFEEEITELENHITLRSEIASGLEDARNSP